MDKNMDTILIDKFNEDQSSALIKLGQQLERTKPGIFSGLRSLRITIRAVVLIINNLKMLWSVMMLGVSSQEGLSHIVTLQQEQLNLLNARLSKLEGGNE